MQNIFLVVGQNKERRNEMSKNKIWKPTLKNWMGKLGFNFDGMFITDPFITPCERFSVDDPKSYYGLSDKQLKQFTDMGYY